MGTKISGINEIENRRTINFIFNNICVRTPLVVDGDETIENLIHKYFKKVEKENLIINNIEKTYFMYNCKMINYKNNKEKLASFFKESIPQIKVLNLDYNKKSEDIEIIDTIKDNTYTCVYKAKYGDKLVAVKKIKKERLKEDIKENKFIDEITEEDFKEEIIKFNKELSNMQQCYCENSVEIYDYFDTEKDFLIIMELCDNNLFTELLKTKNGFNEKEIKYILVQLNNAFKIMNDKNIIHRDIKLHNILVKYLNGEHKKFKVLLGDYGVSNQLNSMTGRYKTYIGTHIIMAPEILEGEAYNNKCDLWSLGVIRNYIRTYMENSQILL